MSKKPVVAWAACGLAAVAFRDDNPPAVGVKQDLGAVESKPARRNGRSVYSVAIDLSWRNAGDESVPIVVCTVRARIERNDSGRRGIVLAVKEQELDAGRGSREQTKVYAAFLNGGAQGAASTGDFEP